MSHPLNSCSVHYGVRANSRFAVIFSAFGKEFRYFPCLSIDCFPGCSCALRFVNLIFNFLYLPIVFISKYWKKTRRFFSTGNKSLQSFRFIFMLIFFFKRTEMLPPFNQRVSFTIIARQIDHENEFTLSQKCTGEKYPAFMWCGRGCWKCYVGWLIWVRWCAREFNKYKLWMM